MEIWKEIGTYLLNALPHIVTIVSIVVSAIVQVKLSKRETKRVIENYKYMLEAERIKSDEARKSAILDKQLEERKDNYLALTSHYAKMVDAFYQRRSNELPESACMLIYAEGVKMQGYCAFNSDLFNAVEALTRYLFDHVLKDRERLPAYSDQVRLRIEYIGQHLHKVSISQSTEQTTLVN